MSYGNLISLLVGGVSAGGGGECWGGVLSYLGKKCEMDRLTNGKKKRDSSGAEAAQWGCGRKEVVVELTTVGTEERSW